MERTTFLQTGNYIELKDGMTIEEGKAKMFDVMIEQLRDLAQDEKFWIVKEWEDGSTTVGWKLGVLTIPVEKRIVLKRADGTEVDITGKVYGEHNN